MRDDSVVIKGNREGIFLHLDPQLDFRELKQKISAKLSASKDFLAGAQVICNFGPREVGDQDVAELEQLLKNYKMRLKRISTSVQAGNAAREESMMLPKPIEDNRGQAYPYAEEQTLLIKRTLRSGQSISYDGNVVVMGDVNPGAEIVASGNVIVMGALRGMVHAGAMGDPASVVAAIRLKPTQLRIADQITRAPDNDVDEPDVPEIARIKDGVVTIERYNPNERQARAR